MEERRVAVVAHVPPSGSSEVSESDRALSDLAALGQPSRLQIFRLLMRHEPDGLQAKAISESVSMPHNTLSTHLAIVARAGLVTGERRGRLIIYRANIQGMRNLISFLVMDCCQGHPEVCLRSCGAEVARKSRRVGDNGSADMTTLLVGKSTQDWRSRPLRPKTKINQGVRDYLRLGRHSSALRLSGS